MGSHLDLMRLSASRREFDHFDFGGPGWTAGTWYEDVHDAMTCTASCEGVPSGAASSGPPECCVSPSRTLMFRVVFRPGSSDVQEVEVAERLLAA